MKYSLKPAFFTIAAVITLYCSMTAYGKTYNWQYWKGPNQNGISEESDWDPACLKKPLKVNWKINVGIGYSNAAIAGDYLYTMGYDEESRKNTLYCLEIDTAKLVWKYSYDTTVGDYPGPRSTPVIDEGRIYTLGQAGDFNCNDAFTGKLIWKRHVTDEFEAKMPRWMFASSVHIDGTLAVVNAGRSGVALNKKNGNLVWKSEAGVANYSTPVPYRLKNRDYMAIFGKAHLYGVSARSGKVIWSYPWQTRYDINAADPVIYQDKIFVTSGSDSGCSLIDISTGRPRELWRNKNLSAHLSTPVIIDDFVYGINGNTGSDAELTCLDMKDGSLRWSKEIGFGNMMAANGYLIIITEKGTLYIVKADSSDYREVSKKEGVLGRLCWTAPVLCRSTLYLRNDQGDLISIDVGK